MRQIDSSTAIPNRKWRVFPRAFAFLLKCVRKERGESSELFKKRTENLIGKLKEITVESNALIEEMGIKIAEKEQRLGWLEKKVDQLHKSPKVGFIQILEKLDDLIVEQNQDERRSMLRDYILFVLQFIIPFIAVWLTQLLK